MDEELVKAIVSLSMHRDEWKIFKDFLLSERETSLHDFTSLEFVKEPQLLAHLSGMIGQADRIMKVIEESEATIA